MSGLGRVAPNPPTSSPTVLIVDDNADVLHLLDVFLSTCGFRVVPANNASDALRLATEGVDIIATDLCMPEMDGFELIRRLRAIPTQPPVPVVVVTGHPYSRHMLTTEHIGCCRLFTKPCDLSALEDTLRFLASTCIHECERCPNRPAARAGT